ncbi:MAG: hypothetical protein GX087_13110 [Desulfobulbaceae bacterium]|nr:hypothetical protein [Desulfobulbaceae bacterium]
MIIQNYNETNVEGSKHTRCKSIFISNKFGEDPTAIFTEEEIHILSEADGDSFIKNKGSISVTISDMEATIEDPETGEVISYGQLYRFLAIDYLKAAHARDLADAKKKEELLLLETKRLILEELNVTHYTGDTFGVEEIKDKSIEELANILVDRRVDFILSEVEDPEGKIPRDYAVNFVTNNFADFSDSRFVEIFYDTFVAEKEEYEPEEEASKE